MLMTSQLKVGTAFMYEGNPLIVQKMLGQRSGRAGMVTSLRVKNLVTNSTMDLGIDAGEKFDEVDLESHVTKLSYIDGETFVFMDQDTYEQFELAKEDLEIIKEIKNNNELYKMLRNDPKRSVELINRKLNK